MPSVHVEDDGSVQRRRGDSVCSPGIFDVVWFRVFQRAAAALELNRRRLRLHTSPTEALPTRLRPGHNIGPWLLPSPSSPPPPDGAARPAPRRGGGRGHVLHAVRGRGARPAGGPGEAPRAGLHAAAGAAGAPRGLQPGPGPPGAGRAPQALGGLPEDAPPHGAGQGR